MIKEILILDHSGDLIIEKSEKTKDLYLTGIYSTVGVYNKNKRRYTKNVMDSEVNKLSELAQNNRLVGELDHPKELTVSLTNASHKIEELKWDGNNVIGRSKILETRKGQDTRALIEAGVQLGVSSRATGNLKKNKNGTFEVMTLNMKTYDLVSNPSNYESFMQSIYEKTFGLNDFSVISDEEQEKTKIILEKIKNENSFKLMKLFYNKF